MFKTLQNWLSEYRLYRRDDKGHVVKQNDHLMDAIRYLTVSGLSAAQLDPDAPQRAIERITGKPQPSFAVENCIPTNRTPSRAGRRWKVRA